MIEMLLPILLASSQLSYKNKDTYELQTPVSVHKALKKYDPHFNPWLYKNFMPIVRSDVKLSEKSNLASVIGDFNGDKLQDVVILGSSKKNDALVAVLSKGQSYRVMEIQKYPIKTDPKKEWMTVPPKGEKEYGYWTFLSHVKPGSKKSSYEKKVLNLKNDAFSVNYWGKALILYYWNGKKFIEYTLAD